MKDFTKLSKNEMKNVTGGVAAPPPGGGTNTWCGHTSDNAYHQCGLSKADAMQWGNYCHDNCPVWPS